MTIGFKRGLWLVAAFLMLTPTAMLADAFLDFNILVPTTGSISYAGGANPLVGTHIDVDSISGMGTPLNAGVAGTLPVIGGILTFSTGNLTGFDSKDWYFGGGGSITLTASCFDVDHDGGACDTGDITATNPIMTGVWDSAAVGVGVLRFKVTTGLFDDTKNGQLLHYFGLHGLPATVYSGTMNLSFLASGKPPAAFHSTTVLSGSLVNQVPTVPEPASLALLGTGLLGVASLARRKFRGGR